MLLRGPIGAGKTVFSAAALRSVGLSPPFLSPTYVYLREYRVAETRTPGLMVGHLDLYRVETEEALERLDLAGATEGHDLLLVEWADRLTPGTTLAPRGVDVTLSIVSETERDVRLSWWEAS